MGRVLVGSIPWVGEVLEEGKNLEACRHLLHPHGAGQSQAGALDGLVAHKVGGQCLQEVVACLVGAASQPGRCGLGWVELHFSPPVVGLSGPQDKEGVAH